MSGQVAPDKTDLLLLLLLAPDSRGRAGPLRGITRLQKLLYLLEREGGLESQVRDPFEFKAFKYGPFSKEVYDVIDFLDNAGFVETTETKYEDVYTSEEGRPVTEELDPNPTPNEPPDPDAAPTAREQTFELTKMGRRLAERLRERLSDDDWERLRSIRRQYGDRPLKSLLAYVYRAYPESASETELRHLR